MKPFENVVMGGRLFAKGKRDSEEASAAGCPGRTAQIPKVQPSLRDLGCSALYPTVETVGYSHSSVRDLAKMHDAPGVEMPGLSHSNSPGRESAFSMIELMVTVALLTVIILGLVAMFSQTRRAFTSSMTQVDVLESGRSAADFIARELEQMTPFGETTGTIPNFYADTPGVNVINQFIWPLAAPGDLRTNNLEEVFFITRNNQQWNIIGYKVFISPSIPPADRALGSLYRYYDTFLVTNAAKNLPQLATRINNDYNVFIQVPTTAPGPGFTHLVDGVVDFRVRAYTTNGVQFYYNYSTNSDFKMNNNIVPGDYSYLFLGASIPAYVEVELGVVEDRVLGRYNALTNNPGNALGYLTNHSAQLHIFRQRVPVLNVNPSAL